MANLTTALMISDRKTGYTEQHLSVSTASVKTAVNHSCRAYHDTGN